MIGRKKEINELINLYNNKKAELVAVYGRRRVGKTYLINQVFKDKFTFKHTALSPDDFENDKELISLQLDLFYKNLLKQGLNDATMPKDWFEAFDLLEKLLRQKEDGQRLVVFIDELPWLDTKKSHFIKAFEYFWNNYGSSNENLMLIICGSANSWIQNNLINNHGGLYGRVTYEIKVSPFNLKETEEYLKSNDVVFSRYDICTSYMILGGIPYYLGYVKKGKSLNQNIDDIFFKKNAQLNLEFDRLFDSCFESSELTKKIVILLNKKKIGYTRKEIVELLHISDGGNISKILNALISSDFVKKYVLFGTNSKVPYYKLIDPFCIFYLKFKYENNNSENYWSDSNTNQTITVWKGLAFETVCFNHITQIKNALNIGGVLTKESSFVFSNDANHGQIDMVILRNDNVINLCEMKYYQDDFVVDLSYYKKLNSRIEAIRPFVSKKTCAFNTLITTYGLKENEYSSAFQNVITLDDLFV